jgi:hypothetical protein
MLGSQIIEMYLEQVISVILIVICYYMFIIVDLQDTDSNCRRTYSEK